MDDPKIQEVEQGVRVFIGEHQQIVIADNEQFAQVEELRKEVKRRLKVINDVLDPFRATAYEAYQKAKKRVDDNKGPLEKLEKMIVTEQKRYLDEQETIRLEAKRKADAEQAEIDRKRKIEADRIENDRLAAAAELERKGDNKGAEAVLESALKAEEDVPPPPPFVATVVPRAPEVDRRTFRKFWLVEVSDLRVLCAAIGAGTVPVDAVTPNYTRLNQMARDFKDKMNIPGVKAIER